MLDHDNDPIVTVWTVVDIAERLGLSTTRVKQFTKQAGFPEPYAASLSTRIRVWLPERRAWDAKSGRVGRPKSGRPRELPLSPALARALWKLQRKPDELLFTSPRGRRMSYGNTYRRVLQPLLIAAETDQTGDLTWAAFHTFRHTCASLQFAASRNVKHVCRWLGHHKPSYTLDTYIP